MRSITDRIAGAPISWGVCEVPGWGHQLRPGRVLAEMRDLGLAATEFGPDGFLPSAASARTALLDGFGLRPVGGFVPVVLHEAAHDPLPGLERAMDGFGAAQTLVLAAATGAGGYDGRPDLDAGAWTTMLGNLGRIAGSARARGVRAALHPHVGTVVERPAEVARVLDGSDMDLCLDTGHLLVGGADPVDLARSAASRISHVHLKDVHEGLAARVRGGPLTYTEAVRAGLYRPLGAGDVDIAAIVRALEDAGYDGWYVMEQDTVLDTEPAAGTGPCADVAASVAFLREVTG
jgi:inosose dehydratase